MIYNSKRKNKLDKIEPDNYFDGENPNRTNSKLVNILGVQIILL